MLPSPIVTAVDFPFLNNKSGGWPSRRPWIVSSMTYIAIAECPTNVLLLGLDTILDVLPSNLPQVELVAFITFLKLSNNQTLPKRDKVYALNERGEVCHPLSLSRLSKPSVGYGSKKRVYAVQDLFRIILS